MDWSYYADKEDVVDIAGQIASSRTIIARDESAVDALRALCIDCPNLNAVYERMSSFEDFTKEYADRIESIISRQIPNKSSELGQLITSLSVTTQLFSSSEENRQNLSVVFSIQNPDSVDLEYSAESPALLFYPGSLNVAMTAFMVLCGKFVFKSSWFIVGLALRKGCCASVHANNLVQEFREKAEKHGEFKNLLNLNEIKPDAIKDKAGIVIFLHGLFSTDIGTFDGFINELSRSINFRLEDWLSLVGWPHNTFSSITQNASDLYEQIVMKIGVDSPPIFFVCHSRGGLLARQVAVLLQKHNPKIAVNIGGCITFGTPHRGAALAEIPLGLVAALIVIGKGAKNYLSLFRVLSYYAQMHFFQGLEDLKSASIGGKFLQALVADEQAMAVSNGLRLLDIYSVGGDYFNKNEWQCEMVTRILGTDKHDCVVELSSSILDNSDEKKAIVQCSHDGYFKKGTTCQKALFYLISCLAPQGVLNLPQNPLHDMVKREGDEVVIGGVRLKIRRS